jgi:hypothetical protein
MTLYDRSAEHTEAEWLFDWFTGVPEPARSALGTGAVRMDGAVVTSMANDPVSFWNKALGFDRTVDGRRSPGSWTTTVSRAAVRGFGMPTEHLPSIAAASLRRGAIEAFGVWDGSSIVAGASLAVVDGVGALLGASILPGHRGRGAQSALIAIRARSARRAGAGRLVAETGRPLVAGGNSSLNNLERAGLVRLYDRTTWNWKAGPAI